MKIVKMIERVRDNLSMAMENFAVSVTQTLKT